MPQSRGPIQIERLFTTEEMGLRSDASLEHVLKVFLNIGEAQASRWIEMPRGVLLLQSAPDNPAAGAQDSAHFTQNGEVILYPMEGGVREHNVEQTLQRDLARVRDTPGGIQHLQREQVAIDIVVEDHSGLVLVAFGNLSALSQDHGHSVGLGIIRNFHGSFLQYFAILVVR